MAPVLTVEGISKRFGPVAALQDVSLKCEAGEVHAIVGENGAGKSTLMGVLAGFVQPDRGSVKVGGWDLQLGSSHSSRAAGIAMVHQHFMLVPEFTVEENLALARSAESGFRLHPREAAKSALAKGQELGWRFEPQSRVRSLSVGLQQRLEILKALASEANILILDEPTAVLRQDEVDELFRVVRDLRSSGKTVLFIAHKLAEVLAVADRISVLRKGRLVFSGPRDEVDADTLATFMLGERPLPATKIRDTAGEQCLKATGLFALGERGEERVRDVTFELACGEILGVGGVDGNGQVELAEALAGVRPLAKGQIEFEGEIAYIPQDRHRDGLALEMTIEENLLVEGHRHPSLRRGPLLDPRKIRLWAEGLRRQFEVAAPNVTVEASTLSGGNQQKVVVARALDAHPNLLIAVNPTRGLDLRATAFVRRQIQHAAQAGAAVVLFSTDVDELEEVATRKLYMSGGRLGEEFLGGMPA